MPTRTVSGKEDYNVFYLCLWNLGHLGSLEYKLDAHKLHNYIAHVFCFNPWLGKRKQKGRKGEREGGSKKEG